MSLFDLPVSKGARVARVVAVVLLNLVLAGSGIAMIASYLGDRAAAAKPRSPGPAAPEPPNPELEVLDPDPVDVEAVKKSPTVPAKKVEAPAKDKAKKTARRSSPAPKSPAPTPKPDKPTPTRDPEESAGPDDPADDLDIVDPADVPDSPPGGAGDVPDVTGTIEDDADEEARVEFSAAMVRRVVDRHTTQLQRCYKAAAKSESLSDPLAGRVDVQFVITPEGTASNVTPVANTTGSPELATCVSKLIESWQFPSPGAEEIAFVWPFVFKAP